MAQKLRLQSRDAELIDNASESGQFWKWSEQYKSPGIEV